MDKIINALKELNHKSPFLWEIRTNGTTYTLYCEDGICEDDEYGQLSRMNEETCLHWLNKIINESL